MRYKNFNINRMNIAYLRRENVMKVHKDKHTGEQEEEEKFRLVVVFAGSCAEMYLTMDTEEEREEVAEELANEFI